MTKIDKIQILRGVAIVAVVLIHTCNGGIWQVVCRPFINFAVALFLFLSGYLTSIENRDWFGFYKRRILRVIIPYIIWTILYNLPHFELKHFIKDLVTTRSAATMYYIFVYIQFVLITPLLGAFLKSKYSWLGWLVSPVSVLVFKYYPLLSGAQMNGYVSLVWGLSCLGWFTYYYLGLLLGNGLCDKVFKIKYLSVLYIASLALQMAEGYGLYLLGETNCGTQMKLSSFLTSTLFLLMCYCYIKDERIVIKSKVLVFLGDYSFGIYLSHLLVMRVLSYIPLYTKLPFVVNSFVVLGTSFMFVFLGKKICGDKISRWLGFA